MVAVQTVHTSGINWGSIAVIVCTIVACFIGVATYIERKHTLRNETIKDDIKESVDHLAAILLERLETKENVNALRIEVERLRSEVISHNR